VRFRLAIGAVVLQVFALAFMAGEREWIVRTGRTVLLRTAPIDPNDPMRGEYARLDYEISHVPPSRLEGGLPKLFAPPLDYRNTRHRPVFARLAVGDDGVADLAGLTDAKPSEGLFIRGRTHQAHTRNVQVRYGIEALFMQQGTAKKLEDLRATEKAGVPLDIEVALSPSGTAVLKNYKWESLGLTVTFERTTVPIRTPGAVPDPSRTQQLITGVKIELKNHGPDDVAVVDLPDAASFRLVPDERWQESKYRWVGDDRVPPAPSPTDVVVLKSGQSHRLRIDLTEPRWFVVSAAPDGNKIPVPLRDVTDPWSASFRVEYLPPAKSAVSGLPNASLIRHGRLRSRAFNPTAGLD
jgi:uncharacterized membrane-anchored protein